MSDQKIEVGDTVTLTGVVTSMHSNDKYVYVDRNQLVRTDLLTIVKKAEKYKVGKFYTDGMAKYLYLGNNKWWRPELERVLDWSISKLEEVSDD